MSSTKPLSDYKLTLVYEEGESIGTPHTTKLEFSCENFSKEEALITFYKLMAHMGMPLTEVQSQQTPPKGDMH